MWAVISKEITGIQLLWETVEGMYLKTPPTQGIAALESETPLLFQLMQTAMMESLLMRMARLMDPEATGSNHNVSLAKLTSIAPELDSQMSAVRRVWDTSNLKSVRNKYLSHNDLRRSQTEAHTLNIPLSNGDVEAMRGMSAALRGALCVVHRAITNASYLDETLSLRVHRELEVLNRSLVAANWFYTLLPDHTCLQDALANTEANAMHSIHS